MYKINLQIVIGLIIIKIINTINSKIVIDLCFFDERTSGKGRPGSVLIRVGIFTVISEIQLVLDK